MNQKRGKRKELSGDAAQQIALNDHPEYRRQCELGTLPDEIIGEDGQPMSPRAHLTIHAVIERQLAADEPRGVAEIARQLAKRGLSRHDVRHEMGFVLTEQMWHVMNERRVFDEEQYLGELREIVRSRG